LKDWECRNRGKQFRTVKNIVMVANTFREYYVPEKEEEYYRSLSLSIDLRIM